jgi:hypothetical protein
MVWRMCWRTVLCRMLNLQFREASILFYVSAVWLKVQSNYVVWPASNLRSRSKYQYEVMYVQCLIVYIRGCVTCVGNDVRKTRVGCAYLGILVLDRNEIHLLFNTVGFWRCCTNHWLSPFLGICSPSKFCAKLGVSEAYCPLFRTLFNV